MKWGWVAFLIGAVFASVARADMFPDASNAKLPDARTNLAIAPHVATNAALTAASTVTYPSGVWRDDFAAGNGAPPLWYMPSGSACSLAAGNGDDGSQVKSANGKCWLAVFPVTGLDVREFGVWTGAADNSAAVNSALAALTTVYASGGSILFPAGTFAFTAKPSLTLPNSRFLVGIKGAGSTATILNWAAPAGGIVLTAQSSLNSLAIESLALTTGTTNGGTALALSNTVTNGNPADTIQSLITDVAIMGSDGPGGTNYWTTGITDSNWSNFTVHDFLWSGSITIAGGAGLGNGISLAGTTAAHTVVWNFANGNNFLNGNTAITLGNAAQGITVGTGNNFTENVTGILVSSACTGACDELTVNGSQFAPIGGDGISFVGPIAQAIITNSIFSAPVGFSGIHINNTGAVGTLYQISGNTFTPASGASKGTGITVTANVTGAEGIISGNVFTNLTGGVALNSGASGWTLGQNSFIGMTAATNVVDSTTANDTIYPQSTAIGGGSSVAVATGATVTMSLGQGTFPSDIAASVPIPGKYPVRAKNMYCFASAQPGVGQSMTVSFRVNGGATPLVCTISGASNVGHDDTHLLDIAAGGLYDLFATSSATAPPAIVTWGIVLNRTP